MRAYGITSIGMTILAACAQAAPQRASTHAIQPNDNRRPAGVLRDDVLTLDLELRRGRWHPDADAGPSLEVLAFAEGHGPPQIPSPLIRVREGTTLRIRIHNTLRDSTLVAHGLHTRPGTGDDTVSVAAGATREVRFVAGAPGTYYYWASTAGQTVDVRDGDDSQLGGAFIVDPRDGASADRVFVLGLRFRPADSLAKPPHPQQDIMVINGKAWPHTERLDVALGDSVTWRWINATNSSHPMHLHGFYFRILTRGDWTRDTSYADSLRPQAVTELMPPGGTMAMRWAATRPGNWLFHCHFAFHVAPDGSLTGLAPPASASTVGGHEHGTAHAMAGLVMGIHAHSAPGAAMPGAAMPAAAPAEPRQLRLLVQSRPNHFGSAIGYGFVLDSGAGEPPRDSIAIPGPMLVLERGQRVRITVVNHLAEPTSVHWHGIELESYPDGVPNWSGQPPRLTPAIAPGDSFAAEFTPPRAGTFIYHSHAHELVQISQGLYGALLVVDRERPLDSGADHVVLASLDGPSTDSAGGFVNGSKRPAPLELVAGRRHRLRLINIDTDHRVLFTLTRGGQPLSWRPLAKDGADLPPAQATLRPARLLTGPGETADMELAFARPDSVTLTMSAPYASPAWTIAVPVRVRWGGGR